MTTQSASAAIALVGKTVRPAHGTERWAMASGKPMSGTVIDIYIPDITRPYVIVQYGKDRVFQYPFELDVITESFPAPSPAHREAIHQTQETPPGQPPASGQPVDTGASATAVLNRPAPAAVTTPRYVAHQRTTTPGLPPPRRHQLSSHPLFLVDQQPLLTELAWPFIQAALWEGSACGGAAAAAATNSFTYGA